MINLLLEETEYQELEEELGPGEHRESGPKVPQTLLGMGEHSRGRFSVCWEMGCPSSLLEASPRCPTKNVDLEVRREELPK